MLRIACVLALSAALAAETVHPPTPPQPGTAPAPAPHPAPATMGDKPFLGVEVDVANFDKGLPVTVVRPGSSAAAMGVQVGDVITAVDGKPVAGADELQKLIADHKVGDAIKLDVTRGGKPQQLSGVLQQRTAGPSLNSELGKTRHDVEELKSQLDASRRDPSLQDVIALLNRFEEELPKAAEKFKKQYPNGEFKIKIEINVTSDKDAKSPVNLLDGAPDPAKDGKDKDAKKDAVDAGAKKDDPAKPDAKDAATDKDAGAKPPTK